MIILKDVPNCKICRLKCHGCAGYGKCTMWKELNNKTVADCTLMASEYYLFEEYLNNPTMQLCKFQHECKSLAKAWLD